MKFYWKKDGIQRKERDIISEIIRNKRKLVWVMVLIMAFSFMTNNIYAENIFNNNEDKTTFQGDSFQVECRIDNKFAIPEHGLSYREEDLLIVECERNVSGDYRVESTKIYRHLDGEYTFSVGDMNGSPFLFKSGGITVEVYDSIKGEFKQIGIISDRTHRELILREEED